MNEALTFKDISLTPATFTSIASRSDVHPAVKIGRTNLALPMIASNMDSVYSPALAKEVARMGGVSVVHRFCSIEENIALFKEGIYYHSEYTVKPWVSIGVGANEIERASALVEAGAETLVIDVANGAQEQVVRQYRALKDLFDIDIIVGNFDSAAQINAFVQKAGSIPTAFKIGIGPGSACVTREVAGVGTPSVTCILDCVKTGYNLIQDGGISTPGDLAKCIALGCKAAFIGRLFAATPESGANWVTDGYGVPTGYKTYRGSASLSSYEDQGKISGFRAPEGEEYTILVSNTVEKLMQYYSGGLRSSMTYLDARTIEDFVKNCRYVVVSHNSAVEASAYGKKG